MSKYVKTDLPVSIAGGVFDPVSAYFLGAILSANEPKQDGGKTIWLAPYRHNPSGEITDADIKAHADLILALLGGTSGKMYFKPELVAKHWFQPNKRGFAVAFESPPGTQTEELVSGLLPVIDAAEESEVRCFVVGAFDGRSSIDHNKTENKIRYLSLDCNNAKVAELLNRALMRLGFGENNYNTSRDRVEGGLPRKNQFRIPSSDALRFIQTIGMICPGRFGQFKGIFPHLYERREDDLLYGLKTLSATAPKRPVLPPRDSAAESEADRTLLEEINEDFEDEAAPFEYAGRPQPKPEPVFLGGHKTYKRDKKKAMNALRKALYHCEISYYHPTFIRKNSNRDYTEPHHLIPLSFSEQFDVSLDIEENIVSLCSNCHNQLHYGRDVRPLLEKLYRARKDALQKAGIIISLEELYRMYEA